MSLKAKVEAIIYAAEEPITLEQISALLRDAVLADLATAKENAAISEADAAAETHENPEASSESANIPELAEDAEPTSPEPGPLMPPQGVNSSESEAEGITSFPDGEQPSQEESPSPDPAETPAENPSLEDNSDAAAPEAELAPAIAESAPEPAAAQEESATPESASPQPDAAQAEPAPAASATVTAPETTSRKRQPKKTEQEIAEDKAVRARLREVLTELVTDYSSEERGMEIRQVAGGFRMATKPEHHDVVRAFAKSLKPPIRLSLAALETLAVIAYKQPVTGPEITDIRGVESAGVLGTLLDRKLITTAGRKQVIGRPMQYKTSKDFLLRFGLNDVNELPSMEEFSQLASDGTIEITPSEPQESPSLFQPESQPDAAANIEASEQTAAAPEAETSDAPSETEVAAQDSSEGNHTPEQQTEVSAEEQPQSEADSSNTPEAAHSNGQQ